MRPADSEIGRGQIPGRGVYTGREMKKVGTKYRAAGSIRNGKTWS